MQRISTKIIFFGTEDFSLTALTGLIEAGYSIAAVVTKPDSKKGRGQKLVAPQVKALATRYNIPVWQPTKLIDIAEDVQKIGSVTGVLVSYGKIIPQSVIDLFTPGIINVHPSLLPKYRGSSPIESAIQNGDDITGLSIMQLSARMDAGPIYKTSLYPLRGDETRPELYHALAVHGTNLLLETLPDIINGTLKPTPQNEECASYTHLLTKDATQLDLLNMTALEAERTVRAHIGFPKSKVEIFNQTIIITRAIVSSEQKTPLDFLCRDGVYLRVEELIAPSGRKMDSAAFIRGYLAHS